MLNFIIKFFGFIWAGIKTFLLSYIYSIFVTSPLIVLYLVLQNYFPVLYVTWIMQNLWQLVLLAYCPFALFLFIQSLIFVVRARLRVRKEMKKIKTTD